MVSVEGLKKNFLRGKKTIRVLKGVDFQVHAGEMVAVVGPSGAGKSTLLHILGTLDQPSEGRLLIDGQDIFRSLPHHLASFRNRTIGFVFQFHHLLPEFNALQNTMMPVLIQRAPRAKAEKMAVEMLEQVGLSNRLDHRPVELSGGEQQRVALARALVMRPKLLLADEPTGNLDDNTARGVHQLLFNMNQKYGMTTIVVTHNLHLAHSMNRCFSLQDGLILDEGIDAKGKEAE